MRVRAALLILAIMAPAGAAAAPGKPDSASCPQTRHYLAAQNGLYRGKPLAPKKLTELPPAVTYMAVYRHVGPCEAPLTMVEYRNPRRR